MKLYSTAGDGGQQTEQSTVITANWKNEKKKKKAKVLTSGVFQLEKHARLCLPFLHHYFPATAVWEVCLTIRLKSGIISIKEEKGKGR